MFLSRCARAKATHSCGGMYLVRPVRIGSGIEEVLWGVPSRSGTTAGGVLPDGLVPACAAAVAVRSPAHTRVRGLSFLYCALPPFGGLRGTVRDGSAFVIFTNDISRYDNEPITAWSTNCRCRSTRRVRPRSTPRDRRTIVSQITLILRPGSPICRLCATAWPATLARTGMYKIQQVSRICTRRKTSIAFRLEPRSKYAVHQSN